MSSSWFGRIVTTEDGVYQPPSLKTEAVLCVASLLVAFGWGIWMQKSMLSLLLPFALLAACGVLRFMHYRKYGPLGKPSVSLRNGELTFSLPQDSRGQFQVGVAGLQKLVVYGRSQRRTFRFVQQDGAHLEVVPGWSVKVEQAAVEFLKIRLSPPLEIVHEEPQTMFASVRGDGPSAER